MILQLLLSEIIFTHTATTNLTNTFKRITARIILRITYRNVMLRLEITFTQLRVQSEGKSWYRNFATSSRNSPAVPLK